MAGIEFTPSQQEAIAQLDHDVSVSAGAGSGKTEVLVSRFYYIVESGRAGVDEILTVTFTEKAAREMKERIIRRFEEKGLEEERRAVESAYIGTIHGFAARVLRENAFEAGVDPNCSVLDEAESAALSHKVFDTLIDLRCRSGDAGAIELLYSLSESELYDVVIGAHRRLCSLGLKASQVRAGGPADAQPISTHLLQAARNAAAFDGRQPPATEEKVRRIREKLPQLAEMLDRCLAAGRRFDWEAFSALPTPTSLFPLSVSADLKPLMMEAQSAVKAVQSALLDAPAHRAAEDLLALVRAFEDAYQTEKRQRGFLDFDDLLMITRDLFIPNGSPSPTAGKYRNKFRFITMDEFQDTNPLQKQIIDAIRRPGRFFTVGDVKQSIYAFNNSDVRVFMAHHRSIPQEDRLVFRENFRSRPAILAFINWLFGRMFEEDDEIPFEELVPGREATGGGTPDVELIIVSPEGGARGNRLAEARAICSRIRAICGMDGQVPFQIRTKDGCWRPAGVEDVVILLRATTHVSIYERALHEARIPYCIVGGRGYFQTQEIRDVLNILRVVDNPLDDIAMAAVLRSPMVRLSDNALYWLSRDHSGSPDSFGDDGFPTRNGSVGKLYAALNSEKALENLSSEDAQKAGQFHDLLSKLHAIRSDGRVTDVIDTALAETDYELALLAMPNGKRKYANLKKLREIAQAFQAHSLFGLSEFIQYVRELETVTDREAEAPTESEGSGVVRVMTIHKAKGLESPVVFAADMSRQRGSKTPKFLVDRDGTLVCRVWNPYQNKWQSPASFEKSWDSFQAEEQSELNRLLYVAATRARDLLIFSGSGELDEKHKDKYGECATWFDALKKALSLNAEVDGETILRPSSDVCVAVRKAKVAAAAAGSKQAEPLMNLYRAEIMQGMPLPIRMSEHDDGLPACALTDQPPACAPAVYPVSLLLDYRDCPKRYHLRYVLRAPGENAEEEYASDADSECRPDAASIGARVHEILRAVEFGDGFESSVAALAADCEPELRELVEAACLRLRQCRLYEDICRSEMVLREVPFRIKLAGFLVTGRMDLLYRHVGGWFVVDYKTGGNEMEHRHRLQVGVYAAAVQRVLGELPQKVVLLPLGGGRYAERSPTQADLMLVEMEVASTVREINAGRFPRHVSAQCEWCDYARRLCVERAEGQQAGL